MKKLVVSLFMLLSTFASLYSNAQEAAVKIDGKQVFFKSGISLPYWLNAGQTIAPSNNVSFLSCVQFIADTTNHSLKFDQVLKISTLANVPAGKVWKIEALAFDTLVVPTNTNSIQVPNNWGTNGTSVGSSSNSTNIPTLYKSPKIYSTPGTYQWVVPPGVTTICVEIWGGGGKGGNAIGGSGFVGCTGGGGAGGYGYQCINVAPNQSFSIIVGTSGNASNFGNILTANAGTNGTINSPVLSGFGGTCNAVFNVNGEDAIWGLNGGSAYNGGIGGTHNGGFNVSGVDGLQPGGGGSGACTSGAGFNLGGGIGGAGQVIIYW